MSFDLIQKNFEMLTTDTAMDIADKPLMLDYIRAQETMDCLIKLTDILTENHAKELEKFLQNRWDNIAGSYLDYTASPDSPITELCLLIAKWLHQQNPAKKVYQYLMYTLTHLHDATDLYGDIDSLPLSVVILSDKKDALIPIPVYLSAPHDNTWYNPYVVNPSDEMACLSQPDIKALMEHHSITRAIHFLENRLTLFAPPSTPPKMPLLTGFQKKPINLYCLNFDTKAPELLYNKGLIAFFEYLESQGVLANIESSDNECSWVLQSPDILTKERLIAKDQSGNTLLHWAAQKNLEKITRFILTMNSDIDFIQTKNHQDDTALMLAIKNNHQACADAIIKSSPSSDFSIVDLCAATPRSMQR